jgi:hypothetical protein
MAVLLELLHTKATMEVTVEHTRVVAVEEPQLQAVRGQQGLEEQQEKVETVLLRLL